MCKDSSSSRGYRVVQDAGCWMTRVGPDVQDNCESYYCKNYEVMSGGNCGSSRSKECILQSYRGVRYRLEGYG